MRCLGLCRGPETHLYNAFPMNGTASRWPRRALVILAWAAAAMFVAGVVGVAGFWVATRFGSHDATAIVPNVVGLDESEARRAAEQAGVVLEIVDERNDATVRSGAVLAQDPPPDSRVRLGRKIRIVKSLGDERIEIPSLVGQSSREVEFKIRQQGLTSGNETRAFIASAPAGTVVGQVPAPGTVAGSETRVHRLVSEGDIPTRYVMPDLTGLPLSRVESWIEASGFRRGAVRRRPADGTPSGLVVGQLPLSGHPIAAKSSVELTVSQ